MKLSELKNVLKENGLRGYSHWNKPQLEHMLIEKGILTADGKKNDSNLDNILLMLKILGESCLHHKMLQKDIEKIIHKYKPSKSIQPKEHKPHLRNSRKEPKTVEVINVDTGEKNEYPSIYQAARALDVHPRIITYHNGKTYKGKYKIQVLTKAY